MLHLTKDAVKELTGYRRKSEQKRWLRENGIVFLVGADGHPRVGCAEIENKLTDRKNTVKRKNLEPNFEALING